MEAPATVRRVIAPAVVAVAIAVVWSTTTFAFAPAREQTVAQPAQAFTRVSNGPSRGASDEAARPMAAIDAAARITAAETVRAEAAAVAKAKAEAAAKAKAEAAAKARAEAAAKAKAKARTEAAAKAKAEAAAKARATAARAATAPRTTSYRGRNHVWIPALGISRSTTFWSCSRSTAVGNYVYRWGCAGSNNVYLFGHAHSVFRALHDAYVGHRLRVGMRVVYADGAGRVRTYAVRFWKVVSPTNGDWAFAAQPRPSLTLQTCVGSNSQYRLIVRLTQV